MANKFSTLLLVSLLFLIEACDITDDKKLKVYNDSKDTVFCLWAIENNFKAYKYSPLEQSKEYNGKDTILTKSNNILFPNDSSIFSSYNWVKEINSSNSKKLNIFVFRYNTLRNKSWDDLKRDNSYDTKISVTVNELNNKKWEIHYK